jgi:hypothetical protein
MYYWSRNMVQRTESLVVAWRALAGNAEVEGWRSIAVAGKGHCRILAGRHFPGNEEAVLMVLNGVTIPGSASLPSGNGFSVRIIDQGHAPDGSVWFGLVRQPAGSLDFFAMMAEDVVTTMLSYDHEDTEGLLAVFLGRVRAWQSFMERDSEGMLGMEAEIGLHGELAVLRSIITTGVNGQMAVLAWCGPLDGIQDFHFTEGAIEVKATTSRGTFPAKVSSLEQLDGAMLSGLFLAGVRLRLDSEGQNLAQRAEEVRGLLQNDPGALAAFETRLLHAGFYPGLSDRYPRTFTHMETKFHLVDDDFPKLTHASVPTPIRSARYEIDLDLVGAADIELSSVLKSIGAL